MQLYMPLRVLGKELGASLRWQDDHVKLGVSLLSTGKIVSGSQTNELSELSHQEEPDKWRMVTRIWLLKDKPMV